MANQLVQYGAVVAGAAAIPAVVSGISAATSSLSLSSSLNSIPGMETGYGAMAGLAAADAGKAFSSQLSSTFTNPAFLTSVGMGLAGVLLSKQTKIPSLKVPNLIATAGVALSVGSLLKQGRAGLEAASRGPGGGTQVTAVNFSTTNPSDVTSTTFKQRVWGENAMMRFPLNSSEQYWLKIKLRQYARKAAGDVNSPGNFHTEIKLPLPATLVDAIKLQYQDVALGMFGGIGVDAGAEAYNAFKGSSGTMAERLGAGAKPFVKKMSDVWQDENRNYAFARRMVQGSQFLSTAADLITGSAPNPHMAVTFQGVALKHHTFTWRLSPDSIAESKALEQIILNLQAAALPSKEGNMGIFLKFPSIAVLEINPVIMEFKPCAIDSVIVNYAPNGVPSFFRPEKPGDMKRYPTEVEFTITFREMDIHTADMKQYQGTKLEQRVAGTPPGNYLPPADLMTWREP